MNCSIIIYFDTIEVKLAYINIYTCVYYQISIFQLFYYMSLHNFCSGLNQQVLSHSFWAWGVWEKLSGVGPTQGCREHVGWAGGLLPKQLTQLAASGASGALWLLEKAPVFPRWPLCRAAWVTSHIAADFLPGGWSSREQGGRFSVFYDLATEFSQHHFCGITRSLLVVPPFLPT